jgi:TyrR family helix-turn-helix protein
LRQRREDILLLVKHFLDVYNKKYNYNKQFNLLALDELIQYDWPGNVREIKNLVERLVILTSDEVITCEHLKGLIRKSNQMPNTNDWDNGLTLDEAIAQVEKRLILKYLIKFRSTRKAAKELGTSQSTVIRRAQKYGLNLPK